MQVTYTTSVEMSQKLSPCLYNITVPSLPRVVFNIYKTENKENIFLIDIKKMQETFVIITLCCYSIIVQDILWVIRLFTQM